MAARKFHKGQKPGETTINRTPLKRRQSLKGDLQMVGPELSFPSAPKKVGAKSDLGTKEPKTRKHPLALSGGRHPPDREAPPKFSTPSPTKTENTSTSQDTPRSPSKAPVMAKAPASGTMSHTPENPTQRASVTSGADKASQNIISGTEAVRRAGDEAAQKKMERLLWGLHGSDR